MKKDKLASPVGAGPAIRKRGESCAPAVKCTPFEFCTAMLKYCEDTNAYRRGLIPIELTNLQDLERVRWLSVAYRVRWLGVAYCREPRSRKHPGVLLNSCPWCGEAILFHAHDNWRTYNSYTGAAGLLDVHTLPAAPSGRVVGGSR